MSDLKIKNVNILVLSMIIYIILMLFYVNSIDQLNTFNYSDDRYMEFADLIIILNICFNLNWDEYLCSKLRVNK